MLIWAAKRPRPSAMAVPSAVGPFCESTNVSCTCSNDPNPDPLTWTTVPGPPAPGIGYSVMTPEVVILPILSPLYSVNHRFPSAPAATKAGLLLAVGVGNSVITPAVVILAMPLEPNSVNHRLPSGPTVIP